MAVPPIVEASPARVAEHDRAGWLALFSEEAVLEDPVGAAQYRGAQLGGFYDTFIAPNEIRFEVVQDAVGEGEVMRDVTIHTRLSTGVELCVPAFVRYQLSADGNHLEALAAYWEVRRMVWQVLRAGLRGSWTMMVLSVHMLRHLGVRGMWGFVCGLTRGVFDRGRRAVASLVDAHNRGEPPVAAIDWPAGDIRVDKVVSSGWSTVCRIENSAGQRGVALFSFAPGSSRVQSGRFVFTARTE